MDIKKNNEKEKLTDLSAFSVYFLNFKDESKSQLGIRVANIIPSLMATYKQEQEHYLKWLLSNG